MSDQEHTVETAGGMTIAHPASNRRFPTEPPIDAEAMQRDPFETMDPGSFQSSNVHSAIYDFGEQVLTVRYLRDAADAIYEYTNVPASEWDGLVNAASKGSYINRNIAYDYPYVKVGLGGFPPAREIDNDLIRRFLYSP